MSNKLPGGKQKPTFKRASFFMKSPIYLKVGLNFSSTMKVLPFCVNFILFFFLTMMTSVPFLQDNNFSDLTVTVRSVRSRLSHKRLAGIQIPYSFQA